MYMIIEGGRIVPKLSLALFLHKVQQGTLQRGSSWQKPGVKVLPSAPAPP